MPARRGPAVIRCVPVRGYFTTWRCFGRLRGLSSDGETPVVEDSVGAVAASSDATGSAVTANANPYPVSLANIPDIVAVGTETSCDTPLKRAVNCTRSLSMVSRRVAPELILRTISPFLTYAAGTRVSPLTLTARYGVSPLSAHHSQMARMR